MSPCRFSDGACRQAKARRRPLWDFHPDEDKLRLRSQDLPAEELSKVMAILLGDDLGDLPEAVGPLYRLNDQADLVAVMPVFDERGLLRLRALIR
ncbi:hypothetical protein D1007_38823 [Hordeum vulgare]|nr:hypothetical protein D1007_38823 [Hordeum vulgare]